MINKGLKKEVDRIILVSEKVISLFLYFSNVTIVVVGLPTSILEMNSAGALIDSNSLNGFKSLWDNLIKYLLFIIIEDIK